MTGWNVRIARRADQDMADILAWTADRFSPQQTEVYAETLLLSLNALLQGPTVPGAKKRDDIHPDVFVLPVARQGRRGWYFIVFRPDEVNRGIDVLRILHDSMDMRRHV
ncbi:MAG: type II toxin-antitoxin system RelE/ParE family toxin [Deltaproteobacteria bacterium]|nr:type II toxin-antitoxin system RelE/ParE family toxin [Candidatus Anaeroferrophillacea bacterium]